MMPSLDHCVSNPSEMTTLTKTLEVFDTYKHRDDKDSDEESFHLPLDDDESDSKLQEPVRNGNGNETEEEILNKFDNTAPAFDNIDSQLEESLLKDDDEEKKGSKDEADLTSSFMSSLTQSETGSHTDETKEEDAGRDFETVNENSQTKDQTESSNSIENKPEENLSEVPDVSEAPLNETTLKDQTKVSDDDGSSENTAKNCSELNAVEKSKDDSSETNDVPKTDVEENLPIASKESDAISMLCDKSNAQVEQSKLDNSQEEKISTEDVQPKECNDREEQKGNEASSNKMEGDNSSATVTENASVDDKVLDKCDNSNDSSKHDDEDLFDISIIRDAEEDNAENAYNEAHPEESEDYDDRIDEKMEEDVLNEKTNIEEDEDEEMEVDKQDDQLKHDDVDIEEDNLKLECDPTKDSSDEDSEKNKKTDLVQLNSEQKKSGSTDHMDVSAGECRLDEVTGNLIGVDGKEISFDENHTEEKPSDSNGNNDSQSRISLKRSISEELEGGAAKKSRTEENGNIESKEPEKPKEKLPLKTLISLSDFMKTRKHNRRLTMHDLEEFCVQKICEVIVHKSELGDVHHQLKLQEQLIETMRKEIQQLTKQARDLEIVNKKLMNDLKQQTATQKPLNPLKITRSVGLQVKFTPTFDANVKRRPPNSAVVAQKAQAPPPARNPRIIPNAMTPPVNRPVMSPQKQPQQSQQQLPKPNTPILSQALQNRRTIADTVNKVQNQNMRGKPAEPNKTGPSSASVIDLTDEDDKKDKNKNSPTKMIPPKNITTVPLRTTPVRVNATAQGIRLTTSQGKVSPITSVVTSSTPQVMYVVQSSPQNVLSPLGPKAVVVNFQSANGVLTSALSGSAVSVIPKQGNTIQLKTVAPAKTLQNNKIIKISKHPAPLPPPPVVRISSDKSLKPIPPKPHLTIRKTDTGIILQWKMPYELDMYEVIASYQLYAYQETSALPSTDMWRKVGDVKALALPMACTLTQFADKNKYYFAVRPVDIHKRIGMFSEPEEISL